MIDKDSNRLQVQVQVQVQGDIESHHEEKNQLQPTNTNQTHKCEFGNNILDIRYEDLRRKAIEAEENNPNLLSLYSQELLIFIQQGMIAWIEEWSKCHRHPINPIDAIDMTDSHKIKESDFIDIDNKSYTYGNNHMAGIRNTAHTDTAYAYSNSSVYLSLSLSIDLQVQVKNLLTHMAISTILRSLSATNKPITGFKRSRDKEV